MKRCRMSRVYSVMFKEKICSEHGALCFIEAARREKAKARATAKRARRGGTEKR